MLKYLSHTEPLLENARLHFPSKLGSKLRRRSTNLCLPLKKRRKIYPKLCGADKHDSETHLLLPTTSFPVILYMFHRLPVFLLWGSRVAMLIGNMHNFSYEIEKGGLFTLLVWLSIFISFVFSSSSLLIRQLHFVNIWFSWKWTPFWIFPEDVS